MCDLIALRGGGVSSARIDRCGWILVANDQCNRMIDRPLVSLLISSLRQQLIDAADQFFAVVVVVVVVITIVAVVVVSLLLLQRQPIELLSSSIADADDPAVLLLLSIQNLEHENYDKSSIG